MGSQLKKITSLHPGEKGFVKELIESSLSLKLIEMGFLPGTTIKLIRKAPFGSPLYVKVNGHYVALREDEADAIVVEKDHDA